MNFCSIISLKNNAKRIKLLIKNITTKIANPPKINATPIGFKLIGAIYVKQIPKIKQINDISKIGLKLLINPFDTEMDTSLLLANFRFIFSPITIADIKDANDMINIPNKNENDITIELAIATNIVIDKVKIIQIQLIKPVVRYNNANMINKENKKITNPITNDTNDELSPKEFPSIVLLNLGLTYSLEI